MGSFMARPNSWWPASGESRWDSFVPRLLIGWRYQSRTTGITAYDGMPLSQAPPLSVGRASMGQHTCCAEVHSTAPKPVTTACLLSDCRHNGHPATARAPLHPARPPSRPHHPASQLQLLRLYLSPPLRQRSRSQRQRKHSQSQRLPQPLLLLSLKLPSSQHPLQDAAPLTLLQVQCLTALTQ